MWKWFYYNIRTRIGWRLNKYFGSYFNRNYAHKKIMSMEEANEFIYSSLASGEPKVIARFGKTELDIMVNHEWSTLGIKKPNPTIDHRLNELSGFFPDDEVLYQKFCDMMKDIVPMVDGLGVWYNVLEEYMVDVYMKNTKVIPLEAIEPYYFDNPWSRILKGKKVLVIHPFAETIEEQFRKREVLFDNQEILPEFELMTIKAVQTLADQKDDRFETWFDALEFMKNQMESIDFDIAIIGCGAYGMPLAVYAKKLGKQAVHMGGATQILFGIKGKRWDDYQPQIKKLYKDSWTRPSDVDKPKGLEKVEDSCYW